MNEDVRDVRMKPSRNPVVLLALKSFHVPLSLFAGN